jgi:fucose permease
MVEAGLGWNSYYYVLLGWSVLDAIAIATTYHPNFMKPKTEDEEAIDLPATTDIGPADPRGTDIPIRGPLIVVITNRFCWLVALYLVLYLGLEISTGGWVVEFMIQVPNSEAYHINP